MSELGAQPAQKIRKPAEYPVRMTACIALDQAQMLAEAARMFRSSESQTVRLALDLFFRANQISPPTNGATHG